ncbi:hypothetical protein WMZ97_20805 [Lentibacillus sp. N15]|uniref:hypothetical protein n=1 Tax=Lentibacillus songyuanensis TaxID=3136161 RepID=UPI0031BA591F
MRKILMLVAILLTTSFVVMACGNDAEQSGSNDKEKEKQTGKEEDSSEENDSPGKNEDHSASASESENTDDDDTASEENNDSNDQSTSKEQDALSGYSSDEIEYARVWLQLGPNQEIDKLYADQIPAGEPLNPNDETSADYPEDVVQLSGTRLVDGVVTYSSNGDGTINVYEVPKRWDGENPAGEDTYQKLIENTNQVSIDPGDDEEVEKFIQILEMD